MGNFIRLLAETRINTSWKALESMPFPNSEADYMGQRMPVLCKCVSLTAIMYRSRDGNFQNYNLSHAFLEVSCPLHAHPGVAPAVLQAAVLQLQHQPCLKKINASASPRQHHVWFMNSISIENICWWHCIVWHQKRGCWKVTRRVEKGYGRQKAEDQ